MKYLEGLFMALLLFSVPSCNTLEYHPYDTCINGETGLTAKKVKAIEESLSGKESFKFAIISDTQRWYDETALAVDAINKIAGTDFVIHCGDQSDFGLTDEFLFMRDILKRLNSPWVVLIGNHDYLGTGEFCYDKIYGKRNFAFTAGSTRFICLDTNYLENETLPDFDFLEKELEYSAAHNISNTIVAMHIKPFCVEFNNSRAEEFHNKLKEFPNLLFCINGHNHILETCDIFNDGTLYYGAPSINSRKILLFTVDKGTCRYEEIDF